MRFDDSLETVLAAETAGPAGIQSSWRQLVDLIGRRRGGDEARAIARLRAIRDEVPQTVRAASARGLERAQPPAALVALFADDAVAIAAPVVRSACLTADEWIELLPTMQPATRGVLRNRRDLNERVRAALESFGPSDFVLPATDITPSWGEWPHARPVTPGAAPRPSSDIDLCTAARLVPAQPSIRADETPSPFIAPEPDPFVPVADVARDLPVVAQALRMGRADVAPAADELASESELPDTANEVGSDPEPALNPDDPSVADDRRAVGNGRAALEPASDRPNADDFAIAELVARIEAHRRAAEIRVPLPASTAPPLDRFHFETDTHGVIRWCDGVERGPVIGVMLRSSGGAVDGGVDGAFARRARFSDGRLVIPGASPAAGPWRISADPAFDRANGRFTGYRGTARRPRPDEEPRTASATPGTDALRQLVHELRTPANAISGFAEMIEREMLGPVASGYRDQAAMIRDQTAQLLGAIEDIDTAARLQSGRLDLRRETVPLAPLLARAVADLEPLAALRKARLDVTVDDKAVANGDTVALERLLTRLLTAAVASASDGEILTGALTRDGDTVRLTLSRPNGLSAADGDLFGGDAEAESNAPGAPLLGVGFAFRLARKLAGELGGALMITSDRLTLRLPAAVDGMVEQATV